MGLKGLLREKIKGMGVGKKITYPRFFIKEPIHFVTLPSFKRKEDIDVRYPLLEPLASVNIRWDKEKKDFIYYVLEPKLSQKEKELLNRIKSDLTELIDVEISVIEKKYEAMAYLEKKVQKVLEDSGTVLSREQYVKLMYYIFRDFIGLNEIEPPMHDPYIEDVGCDGVNVPIYVIHRKFGSVKTNIIFKDPGHLSNFVIKLAERCGRYVSYATPLLDGALPDGSRVQASLAKDITTKGPTFSIRKFRKNPLSPIEIMNLGSASAGLMAYLWLITQSAASMLVCGGVSTGKTSFLNAISMFIPAENKIVSIEDTRELNMPHENWIPSVSRLGFGVPGPGGRRYGEVTLFELLKESFRQNPDHVIVGEVRGKEAYVLFQGMASGHPSLSTIHAGSIDDVIKRLETPPIELSPSLVETLDLLIVMVRAKERGESARRVKEIVEIQSVDAHTGKAHVLKTFTWVPFTDEFESDMTESRVLRRISDEKGIPYPKIIKELENRKSVLEWMQRHDVTRFDEVCELINSYYKDPDTVLRWVAHDIPPYKAKAKVREMWESVTGLKVLKE